MLMASTGLKSAVAVRTRTTTPPLVYWHLDQQWNLPLCGCRSPQNLAQQAAPTARQWLIFHCPMHRLLRLKHGLELETPLGLRWLESGCTKVV